MKSPVFPLQVTDPFVITSGANVVVLVLVLVVVVVLEVVVVVVGSAVVVVDVVLVVVVLQLTTTPLFCTELVPLESCTAVYHVPFAIPVQLCEVPLFGTTLTPSPEGEVPVAIKLATFA